MRPSLPHLAARIFNRPLLVTPARARATLAVLGPRLGIGSLVEVDHGIEVTRSADALEQEAAILRSGGPGPRKVYDVVNGVAVIPIEGTLVNKTGTIDPYSGMTGYDGLTVKLTEAFDDSEVRAILLDIDSGGGEVAGCFDLVDLIHANRGRKPVWSVLSEDAYSAAYAIASAADRITVPGTGGVGSIGVVCLHADYSGQLAEAGVKVTLIHAGAHKVDGNPYQPLPDDVRGELQAEIDQVRETFAQRVARGRSAAGRSLSVADVLATEARTFMGAAGVTAGLADAVMSPRDAFAALVEEANRPKPAVPGRQAAGSKHRRENMNRSEFFGGVAAGALLAASPAADDEAAGATAAEGDDTGDEDEEDQPDDTMSAAALQAFVARHPKQAEALARYGAASERKRITSLQALAEPGEDKMLAKAIAEGWAVDKAALTFAEGRRTRRAAALGNRQAEAAQPVAAPATDPAAPAKPKEDANAPIDVRAKAAWEASADLQAEFGGKFESYLAFRKAEASGQARIFSRA
ncbi:MAG: S49 family peptidase [Inquilinus sp.]|uniref:S49 family peptidase n=1 Tax=Inquilinus sp. TaxID=1932117 RepID=UPI003F399D6D